MPRGGPNYTELTHQVVRESPEPLGLDAITAQVVARAGAATKHPKNTVRSALTQSSAIARLADGRYGWKARLINGATHRVIIHDEDLLEREIFAGEALRDLLLPTRHESGKYDVKGPPAIELAGGPTLIVPVTGEIIGRYRMELGEPFWDWLQERGARPGDSLLVSAVDGEARRYRARYEPAAARDEALIARRSQDVLAAAVQIARAGQGRVPIWEIVGRLNTQGLFHHPTPPEPFEELWTKEVWGPLADELDTSPLLLGGFDADLGFGLPDELEPMAFPISEDDIPPGMTLDEVEARLEDLLKSPTPPRLPADDPLLPLLSKVMAAAGLPSPSGQPYTAAQLVDWFGSEPETLEWIIDGIEFGMVAPEADPNSPISLLFAGLNDLDAEDDEDHPADLPDAYRRDGGLRRAQPSPAGSKGPVKTYTLRVTYRFQPDASRDIEIAHDQNLEDLHLAIQQAFGWADDHLYSFYTGSRPYDRRTEIGSPWSEAVRHTHQVSLGSLELRKGKKLLYHFDYGDDHLFDVEVLGVNSAAPKGRYPKVVGRKGKAPEQYPADDEDWDDDDFDSDDE